jgi:hypothetical protein
MITYFHFMALSILSSFLVSTDANTKQTVTININVPQETLMDEQEVFSQNICKLIEYINAKGYHVTLGEAYRTHEQALIYAHEGLGIKNSLHCERLAMDLNIISREGKLLSSVEELMPFGEYWESLNEYNVWGGKWTHRPDSDHFQMSDETRK